MGNKKWMGNALGKEKTRELDHPVFHNEHRLVHLMDPWEMDLPVSTDKW